MNQEQHPAGDNIVYLRQGIELIERLDDEAYTAIPDGPFRGGVGSQFRHCIDFYLCFLRGLAEGRVDYGSRDRDARIETDRGYAVERTLRLIDELSRLNADAGDRVLQVRSDLPASSDAQHEWSGSTMLRELQFLVSHTIHHYALIVSLLMRQGMEPGPELAGFGVAPSTLDHWKATAR
jgi:uncharacterized damage-inducible protein DinB